jgi:hypothetical protein
VDEERVPRPKKKQVEIASFLPEPAVITAPSRIAYMIRISEPGIKAAPVAWQNSA